jgi:predicted transcriptional regulator
VSGLAYDAWDGPQAWHDEAEHGQYVPPDDEPTLLYLDLTAMEWWQRRDEDSPWFRAHEPTPIFDALVDEWPEHLQRLREERMRRSMAGVGRAFRQMAGLMTAMSDGLREGAASRTEGVPSSHDDDA